MKYPGSQPKIVLMRAGSVTHHSDFDQRYIELPVNALVAKEETFSITVGSPSDSTPAPQGYYMLFIVERGVPSVAATIRVP